MIYTVSRAWVHYEALDGAEIFRPGSLLPRYVVEAIDDRSPLVAWMPPADDVGAPAYCRVAVPLLRL
jgi:hypothetical protein